MHANQHEQRENVCVAAKQSARSTLWCRMVHYRTGTSSQQPSYVYVLHYALRRNIALFTNCPLSPAARHAPFISFWSQKKMPRWFLAGLCVAALLLYSLLFIAENIANTHQYMLLAMRTIYYRVRTTSRYSLTPFNRLANGYMF